MFQLSDKSISSKVDISWGFELTIIDTPNTLYSSVYESERTEEALLEMLKRKNNRFFYIVSTPKMRIESRSFIQRLIQLKEKLRNFEFVFIKGNKDPDEEILKLAISFNCPVISNDKFKQKQYDQFRDKKIEIWRFKISKKTNCLKIYDKWKL